MTGKGQGMDVDFTSAEFQRDYQSIYSEMHQKCPFIHASHGDFYAVAKHSEVMSITLNTKLWSSKFGPGLAYQPPEAAVALVNVDPPEHTTDVKLVMKAFTKAYFDSLEPDIQAFVDQRLDSVQASGAADLHDLISIPLPLFVISKMLGIDFSAHGDDLDRWVRNAAAGVLMTAEDPRRIEIFETMQKLNGFLLEEINGWRAKLERGEAQEDDNLLTRLISAHADGQSLSQHKLVGFANFLLVAGSRTTTILISNLIHRLLTEPVEFARLTANPDLQSLAIEETLRVDAPVHGLFRTNNEPAALGPLELPKDSKVMLLWAAANLDPEVFSDPLRFDLTRDPATVRKHLSFGYGLHICRGAPLARLETLIVLRTVLNRLKNLRLNGIPEQETRMPVLMGLRSLPVAWDV
jgi:cytochrome P450